MDHLTYAQWGRALIGRIGAARLPVHGMIELTRRCNLACVHCYNRLPEGLDAAGRRELETDDLFRVLEEIAAAGCLWLLLTGGEALVREDFARIYARAREAGLLVTLFTNAVRVTPAVADALAERPPLAVEVTLYGCTGAVHDGITRAPGSFERALEGIGHLRERGLALRLKTMALAANRHELEGMKKLAADLGAPFRFDPVVVPRLDGGVGPLAGRLTPDQAVELDLRFPERLAEWRRLCDTPAAPTAPAVAPENSLFRCGAGHHSFAIDPWGGLRACGFLTGEAFDLRRGGFSAGWEALGRERERRAVRTTRCHACELRTLCGICPAHGLLEGGDPEEPVDFLCRLGHLRARAIGLSVPAHGQCPHCPPPELA